MVTGETVTRFLEFIRRLRHPDSAPPLRLGVRFAQGASLFGRGLLPNAWKRSGVTDAAPGSERGVHMIVDDVVAARDELAAAGVAVSEVFHDAGGVFHHAGTTARVAGAHPRRQSYGSFASFADPDGNTFVLQEVTTRRPGRISHVVYRSAAELEAALRDAATAHGTYEGELGHSDPDWPAWYADRMARAAGLGS